MQLNHHQIKQKKFFNKIKQGVLPKTAALNPDNYIEIFEPILKSGQDVLYVHFSSGLSATFDFLNLAKQTLKEKYPDREIKTVDTYNISLGAGIIAYMAALEHKKGKSDEEVIRFVESLRDHVSVYFVVDDLHHLKRGGRISSAQAIIGSMLNVKPILTVTKGGKLVSHKKASGVKKALLEFVEKMKQEGDDVANYPIGILHADSLKDAEFLRDKVREVVGDKADIWLQEVGPTVGTHCGPGTIGLAFHSKGKIVE